jgi:general secretion pathway protein L
MLIIALPLHTEGAATEYLHVRAGPGAATGHAQSATAARLPRDAGTVVAVVPAQALAWHTITPPPVGAARLAAALEGLLEERLLEDPAQSQVVYTPDGAAAAAQGQTLTVLVCQKAWLRQALAPLQAQGMVVSRIVPEWSPQAQAAPVLWVGGSPEQVQAVACGPQGAMVLPPPPWSSAISATLNQPEAQLLCEPAMAAWVQQQFGRAPRMLSPGQRLWQAQQTDWDLAQGEWAQGRRQRWARFAHELALNLWQAPRWRPARWGLLALLVLNLVGLQWMAWQQRQLQAQLQKDMAMLLTRSFPAVQVVVDAPLQMAREVQALQRAMGQPNAADLEPMLTSLARTLPASAQLSSVQFSPGELRWQAPAVTNDRIEAAREPLRQQGYQLVADGTYWVLRTEVRP